MPGRYRPSSDNIPAAHRAAQKKGASQKGCLAQKKGASGLNPEAPLLFAATGAEASGRMDQFLNVSPSLSASIEIGFERSTSPARIRFERSLTT